MKDNKQGTLFDKGEWWEEEWQGMPEFVQENQTAFKSLIVNFADRQDMDNFTKLIGQRITINTQSIWYPEAKIEQYANKRYIDTGKE